MAFEHFPYTNFHDLNLDWILEALQTLENSVKNFISINAIKYADPIQWNITSQYEKNTVVLDMSGNAYLSVQAVPSGVSLDRTEYWTVIGNFSALWENVKSSITTIDEGHNTTASAARSVNTLVWVDNTLLRVVKPMIAGDSYNTNTDGNSEVYTIQMLLNSFNAETGSREAADTALETSIINETTNRTQADAILQTSITAVQTSLDRYNAVTPEQFGAVGDGVADDYTAINTALTYAKEHRKTLLFTNYYYISQTISIPREVAVMSGSDSTIDGKQTTETGVILTGLERLCKTELPNITGFTKYGLVLKCCIALVFCPSIRGCGDAVVFLAEEDAKCKGSYNNTVNVQYVAACDSFVKFLGKEGGTTLEGNIAFCNLVMQTSKCLTMGASAINYSSFCFENTVNVGSFDPQNAENVWAVYNETDYWFNGMNLHNDTWSPQNSTTANKYGAVYGRFNGCDFSFAGLAYYKPSNMQIEGAENNIHTNSVLGSFSGSKEVSKTQNAVESWNGGYPLTSRVAALQYTVDTEIPVNGAFTCYAYHLCNDLYAQPYSVNIGYNPTARIMCEHCINNSGANRFEISMSFVNIGTSAIPVGTVLTFFLHQTA